MGDGSVDRDEGTVAYFDEHLIDYGVGRLEHAAELMRRLGSEDASVVDLGCGTGNTLAYVRERTGIDDLMGIDVSPRCLEKVRERVGCETELGSILDRDLAAKHADRFEFAIVAAVLHHMIGRTRRQSRRLAATAVENAMTMLRPGGYLIVLEESFRPNLAIDVLFYVKKAVSRLTSDRVKLFGSWNNNIGPPVVAYLTHDRLYEIMRAQGRAELVDTDIEPEAWGAPFDKVLRKTNLTLVARKRA